MWDIYWYLYDNKLDFENLYSLMGAIAGEVFPKFETTRALQLPLLTMVKTNEKLRKFIVPLWMQYMLLENIQ